MILIPETSDFENNIGIQADWAEISCIFGKHGSLAQPEVQRALELADLDSETMSEDIWSEIDWRHTMAPNAHPVRASKDKLERIGSWKDFSTYSFLLLLAWQSTQKIRRTGNPWSRPSKLFERLVTAVFEKRWGHAINTGSPREIPVPRSFDKCLKYICRKTHEDRDNTRTHTHYSKDRGVDVVAWDPFDDRPGQVLLLVQCATGANWKSKIREINLEKWRYFIRFASIPTRAFAFPYTIRGEDDVWWDLSIDGGLLIDRLRIVYSAPPPPLLEKELVGWSKDRVKSLSWDE